MFNVGDKVVYPVHGVGTIEMVEEREVLGKKQLYYFLKLDLAGMTMMIPVDQSDKVRLRAVSHDDNIENVLSTLNEPCGNLRLDWKIRYSNNHEKLKEGSVRSLSEIVRDLFHRNIIKELSRGEKKLYDSAFQLLCDELSYSQNEEKELIESSILNHLKSQKTPA